MKNITITYIVTYTLSGCTITRKFTDMIKACECSATARRSNAKNITLNSETAH